MPTLFHMKSKFSSRTKSFTKHLISFSFHKTAKIKENLYIFQRGKRSNFINMHFALQIIIRTLTFKPTAVKCIPLFSFRRRQKKLSVVKFATAFSSLFLYDLPTVVQSD